MSPELKHTHAHNTHTAFESAVSSGATMTASSQTHKTTHVSFGHIYPACVGDSGLISICHKHPADPTTDPRPAGLVQRLAFPSAAWAPVSTMGREPKARLSDKAASHPNQGSERQGHRLWQSLCVLCSPSSGVGTTPIYLDGSRSLHSTSR